MEMKRGWWKVEHQEHQLSQHQLHFSSRQHQPLHFASHQVWLLHFSTGGCCKLFQSCWRRKSCTFHHPHEKAKALTSFKMTSLGKYSSHLPFKIHLSLSLFLTNTHSITQTLSLSYISLSPTSLSLLHLSLSLSLCALSTLNKHLFTVYD